MLPLAGIRVLELTHTVMGPSCGVVLADLGADVIKIEPPDGDHTRELAGFAAGFFSNFNRNKRSLAVDLKSPAGRDIALRLVSTADVLIENFRPGAMQRLGLGYAELSEVNPRLIYCALKGFLRGPYEQRPALDEVTQFMGGLAYMTGPRGQPLRAGASVVDILGGTFGVVGILAALQERTVSGRGQEVKSALFESTVWLMGQHMAGEAMTGQSVPPMPERWSAWGVYQTFATADNESLFVGITSNPQWQRFCEAFDRRDLLEDPRLATNEDRVREKPWLTPTIAELLGRYSKDELIAICQRISVPFAPVAVPGDLFEDPHLNTGGHLAETCLPNGSYAKLPLLPLEMSGRSPGLNRQPPVVGQHSSEILGELGFSAVEIDSLQERRVVTLGAAAESANDPGPF